MLQAVITAFPILLLEIDEEGVILDYKSDSPSPYHVRLETFLNRPLNGFFPDQVADELGEILLAIKEKRQPPNLNYATQLEDGEHWFEARFILSNSKGGTVIIQDITRYKASEAKLQKQLDQMSALLAIDHAITSSVDLNLTLSILLTQVVNHLQIDAASILLWGEDTKKLEFAAGLGFRTNALRHTKLGLGEGYAGIAALEQRVIQKVNLLQHETDFLRSPSFGQEEFVSYYGVPLIAKGQVLGVLEIFKRSTLNPDDDWLRFLETLGRQAAIAVDSASLLSDLQRSNAELTAAYDATVEGWARALDMRDHNTERHTKSVVEKTLQLARQLELPDSELIHLRRGATLHDIGEMGIPDRILHKPGQLTEEEWEIMRQHPQFAYDLLAPIEYLRPAIDIPHYHHERWDGSGYPLGLKEEEIPLPARLFTVVDVYDALTSDRPHRPPWSKKDALSYIEEEAGKLFDPAIVPPFLELVREEAPHY
jgi:GAF domain-containing protein